MASTAFRITGPNSSQRLILRATAVVVLLMTLFPPFSARYQDISGFLGYAPIWMPPRAVLVGSTAFDRAAFGAFGGTVDVQVLLVQIAVVTLAGVLLTLAAGGAADRRPRNAEKRRGEPETTVPSNERAGAGSARPATPR